MNRHTLNITIERLLLDFVKVCVTSNPTGTIMFKASQKEAMTLLAEMLQLTPPAAPFSKQELADDN